MAPSSQPRLFLLLWLTSQLAWPTAPAAVPATLTKRAATLDLPADGSARWRSGPAPIATLDNAAFYYQDDGNLVGHVGSKTWSSKTANQRACANAACELVFQPDGNFVMYGPDGQPYWQTYSNVHHCRVTQAVTLEFTNDYKGLGMIRLVDNIGRILFKSYEDHDGEALGEGPDYSFDGQGDCPPPPVATQPPPPGSCSCPAPYCPYCIQPRDGVGLDAGPGLFAWSL